MNTALLYICAMGFIALAMAQDALPGSENPNEAGPAPEGENGEFRAFPEAENGNRARSMYVANNPLPVNVNTPVAYQQKNGQGGGNGQGSGNGQANLVRPTGYAVAPGPVVVQDANVQVLSAVDASRQLIAAAVAQGANPNNFGVQTGAHYTIENQPNPENPDVWDALDVLRGRGSLTIDEILNILAVAVPGKDYPIYNDIPTTVFSCEKTHQAGFYADVSAQCQVIRRCDINGVMWSYLCPNMTLFNQITLVCDWFFNVNCNNAAQFYDYSNPRLYTQFALLDTPNAVVQPVPASGRPIIVTAPQPVQLTPGYSQSTVYHT